jgi:hypothetical protein
MFAILNIVFIFGARLRPEPFLLIVFTSIISSLLITVLAAYAYQLGVKKTGKSPLKAAVIQNSIFAYGYAFSINTILLKAWYFYIILIVISSFLTGWRMSQFNLFKSASKKNDE